MSQDQQHTLRSAGWMLATVRRFGAVIVAPALAALAFGAWRGAGTGARQRRRRLGRDLGYEPAALVGR